MAIILSKPISMTMPSSKAQKMFHISACILVLEMRKGHLAWKVTEVVKKTGFSRALIYQYFGGDREQMLKAALRIFVERFYGFEDETTSFCEMVGKARQYILDYPDAALFYQKVRMSDSTFAKEFQEVEMRFRARLQKKFPSFSKQRIIVLHTFIHGMVTAPFLTKEESVTVCESLSELMF